MSSNSFPLAPGLFRWDSIGRRAGLLVVAVTFCAIYFDSHPNTFLTGEKFTILCFGDSLTAGFVRDQATGKLSFHPYSSSLSAALGPRTNAIPLGFSGWRSVDLLDAADKHSHLPSVQTHLHGAGMPGLALALKEYKPKLAIILVGTNDVRKAKVPEELNGTRIAESVWKLHEIAHRASVRTLALGIPEWEPDSRRPPPAPLSESMRVIARQKLNDALRDLARNSEGSQAKYLDFPIPFKKGTTECSWDGVHFTREGYASVGRALSHAVRREYPDVAMAVQ